MLFDDRLNTVLAQPALNAHDRAVRWRQLVELLARASDLSSPLAQRALADAAETAEDHRGDVPGAQSHSPKASGRRVNR